MHNDNLGEAIHVGDSIMYIDPNGNEFEGTVIKLLTDSDMLIIDTEAGQLTISAHNTYKLP